MKKYIVEAIGTFFLVFTIGLSGSAIAIVAVLIGMIYLGGHISKAHYNPAVTIAFLLQKKIATTDVLPYVIAQFAGGILAAALACWITDSPKELRFAEGMLWQGIVLEILFTFAMVLVILNVAIAENTTGNQYYGVAIGAVVFAGISVAGPISGAAFNPAVSLSVNLFAGSGALTDTGIHVITTVIGAVLASFAYKVTNVD